MLMIEVVVFVQGVCDNVTLEREKSVLKQGAVQHLYGKLAGQMRPDATDASLLVLEKGLDLSVEALSIFKCMRWS